MDGQAAVFAVQSRRVVGGRIAPAGQRRGGQVFQHVGRARVIHEIVPLAGICRQVVQGHRPVGGEAELVGPADDRAHAARDALAVILEEGLAGFRGAPAAEQARSRLISTSQAISAGRARRVARIVPAFWDIRSRIPTATRILNASVRAQTEPVNFVVILADDLGAGELGCYGESITSSPPPMASMGAVSLK